MLRNLALYLAVATLIACQASPAQAEDKLKELIKSDGYIEIKLIEARVPDLDPLPMQRDSDVFVRVYLNKTRELICETKVVQDDNSPKFKTDCRTKKPVDTDTVVQFELFDSDKPAPEPDWIGQSNFKVSDLILNRKLGSELPFPIEGRSYPKYYFKAKIDFKPEK